MPLMLLEKHPFFSRLWWKPRPRPALAGKAVPRPQSSLCLLPEARLFSNMRGRHDDVTHPFLQLFTSY